MAKIQRDFSTLDKTIQIFAMLFSSALLFFAVPIGFFACYCLYYSPLWPLLFIYLVWWYVFDRETPKRLGRKWQWLRRLKMFHCTRDYLSGNVVNTHDLDCKRNYIFCNHPHGIMAMSLFFVFGTELSNFSQRFPGMDYYIGSLNWLLDIPFAREYYMGFGVCSVSKESLLRILNHSSGGKIAVITVGGAEEAFNAIPGEATLKLKERYGFVKLALQTGSPIIPAYTFGENELYKQVSFPPGSHLRRFQDFLKRCLGFAPIIPYGRFLWLPFQVELTTIIGEPLEIPKMPNPSEADIHHYHAKYIQHLTKLFNDNKAKYSQYPDAVLKIR